MILPNKLQIDRRHALFALAVLLLLAGATALILNSDDFRIRSLGVSACVVSAYLVRKSRLSARSILEGETYRDANLGTPKRVGYVTWAVSIILLPLLVVSFLCLYSDALHGYREIWPVYLFAAAAAVCSLFWSYVASRLM